MGKVAGVHILGLPRFPTHRWIPQAGSGTIDGLGDWLWAPKEGQRMPSHDPLISMLGSP